VAIVLKDLHISLVTLIPTGRLSLLPLHAAKYIKGDQMLAFIDEFTVTYTPSARTLEYCQEILARLSNDLPTLLGIGNPLPQSSLIPSLIFARPEVEEIALLFKTPKELYETEATRASVEEALNTATYIHFSCHGYFNAESPLDSGVLLSNSEPLRLRDLIIKHQLKNTRLTVLSACQTAVSDFVNLPEEAIGLPSGFLQAGSAGVIGSLWSVNDLSTALLMIRFYQEHLRNMASPAEALRRAQLWLRSVTNAELAELFNLYRRNPSGTQSRITYETAQASFLEYTLAEPGTRPFADPYYWAPFVFYGA